MRHDRQRLDDIVEALASLSRIVEGTTEIEFLTNEVIHYAAAQRLTVVGEAAARISAEVRARHSSIPWADIVAFRNILVHEYFGIHWPVVWVTVIEDVPRLLVQIEEVLRIEFPNPAGS
jgi:uncharacterized protein with HEPN domain